MPEPLPRLLEVLRPRPVPELGVERLPEPLALPERLRVVRPRHDVPDPLPLEHLLEVAPPPPAVVLPPLVRQHLQGLPEARDRAQHGLDHHLAPLVRREIPPRHVPREVVEEDDQVAALPVTRQKDARDVTLPELPGPAPLEAPHRRTPPRRMSPRKGPMGMDRRVPQEEPVSSQKTSFEARSLRHGRHPHRGKANFARERPGSRHRRWPSLAVLSTRDADS